MSSSTGTGTTLIFGGSAGTQLSSPHFTKSNNIATLCDALLPPCYFACSHWHLYVSARGSAILPWQNGTATHLTAPETFCRPHPLVKQRVLQTCRVWRTCGHVAVSGRCSTLGVYANSTASNGTLKWGSNDSTNAFTLLYQCWLCCWRKPQGAAPSTDSKMAAPRGQLGKTPSLFCS